ncbi:hypothetical protein N9080_03570 [Akkermansiaceae bacterium]|nr:hypothetical protein [Akkermansiaceae bacterium]MDB4521247.1 hypothetical protein [Akkermansiaceae bacterium]MDB4765718.1 hypothetical protein [Akkermansiaceae bacterium]
MGKMEGVEKVMLSGMTAFVTTKSEDVKFTRVSVGKALKAGGLKLERVKQREIAAPKEAYAIAVTGGT